MKTVEEFAITNSKNSYSNLVNTAHSDPAYLKFCHNITIFEVF